MNSTNEILEDFGKNVKMRRLQQKISQEKLAEIAGLHRTYIGMIERGEKNITLLNINKIAVALGVEVCDLLKLDHNE